MLQPLIDYNLPKELLSGSYALCCVQWHNLSQVLGVEDGKKQGDIQHVLTELGLETVS